MRTTLSLCCLLSLMATGLSGQVASTPRVRIPDLSGLGPIIAEANVRAAWGLEQAAAVLPRIAPAIAQARAAISRANATLAATAPAISFAWGSIPAIAWSRDFDQEEFEQSPPEGWAQQDPADKLYRDARAALNRQRYESAIDLFRQIYTKYPHSSYAGDAYYWQAVAYYRRGNETSLRRALEVLKQQREKAPEASTRDDAKELATRIQGELAKGGDEPSAAAISAIATAAGAPPTPPAVAAVPPVPPTRATTRRSHRDCENEDEIQTAALNALQQMDAEKALPILRRVLARRDAGSECLRRKAVFIVSQQEGRESEQILLDAARNDPDSEVREQSVFWLSQTNSATATAALDSILRSASDPVLQDKAIFALSQQNSSRARQALKDFALRSSVSDDLREKAIFWIGQGDDPDRLEFLKTLYGQLKSEALRDKILFSISQIQGRESSQWLLGVAADVNENIELRKKALFWVGQSDYPLSELTTLYDRMPSREMKEQLIFVYSQRNERGAVDRLMQIAQTEKDIELRKRAIFWLSQSNDPRVADFLARLLEKP